MDDKKKDQSPKDDKLNEGSGTQGRGAGSPNRPDTTENEEKKSD